MQVEAPPIEGTLKAYLMRMFNKVFSEIALSKPQIGSTVKNPIKGRLYLVEVASEQFTQTGLYYYNGTVFIKLD